jgi:hypothetical protein
LVIDVSIENSGRTDETPYNPLYFSIKDADGYEYNTAFLAPDPSLKSGALPKGERVRGFVAFEIRSASVGLILTYEPLVILGGYEPIRIDLEAFSPNGGGQGTPLSAPCEVCNFECPGNQGEFEFCIADPDLVSDRNQFEKIIKDYCQTKGGDFCKMLVWTDISFLPNSLPMSEAQLDNQVADYTRNVSTGIDCLKLLSRGSVIYSSEGCK